VDLVPVGERVRNAGGDGAPRKRIDPAAPFLNSVYDAGVWFNDAEPDLTFFDAKPGVPRDLPLFKGGNLNTPGDPAPRGFPLVLAKGPAEFHNGSGRLELGERIFSDAAPLSARVIVNRVWGWHFDKHLVGTPSDFGVQGLPPTHPAELLGSAAMRRTIDTLRTRFDRIIIDMPPVEPLADVHILTPLADAVLMIVRAGMTEKPAIDRALHGLDISKVLGLVLNEAAGGDNYDAYSGYGYGYVAG